MSKCGEKTEVYSRVTGYFRPVSNWNKGKKEEFAERKMYQVPTQAVLTVAKTAVLLFALCLLSGCGHNAVVYGDAVGVEIGFVPEQFQFALNFRYGKTFTAVVKEKTKVSLTTDAGNTGEAAGGEAAKGSTSTGVKTALTLETGDQITGYTVDLEKVKQAQSVVK